MFHLASPNLLPHKHFNEAVQTEHNWLEHDAMEAINKDKFDKEQISRATYHVFSYKVEATAPTQALLS